MSRELSTQGDPLQYSIFDPTGNITALVESPVPVERQPAVAAALMARHPEVEQVGFVRFPDPAGWTDPFRSCVWRGASSAATRP